LYFWDVRWGDSDAKLSLVRRPFELLADDLGFRIELYICNYLGCIIPNEASFIRRFKCFHLKKSMIVAYKNMNAIQAHP
jgi:hypothetical protein